MVAKYKKIDIEFNMRKCLFLYGPINICTLGAYKTPNLGEINPLSMYDNGITKPRFRSLNHYLCTKYIYSHEHKLNDSERDRYDDKGHQSYH